MLTKGVNACDSAGFSGKRRRPENEADLRISHHQGGTEQTSVPWTPWRGWQPELSNLGEHQPKPDFIVSVRTKTESDFKSKKEPSSKLASN